jgi:hypothetical protein
VRDIVLEHVRCRQRAWRGGWGRQRAAGHHVPDLANPGVTTERERLAADQFHAVVLFRIVRGRDLRAAVEPAARGRVVQHVRASKAVIDHLGPLHPRPFDEGGSERRRRHPHVMGDGDAAGLEVGDERAADVPCDPLVDLVRVGSANVVRLEDPRVHDSWHICSRERKAAGGRHPTGRPPRRRVGQILL